MFAILFVVNIKHSKPHVYFKNVCCASLISKPQQERETNFDLQTFLTLNF